MFLLFQLSENLIIHKKSVGVGCRDTKVTVTCSSIYLTGLILRTLQVRLFSHYTETRTPRNRKVHELA